jgi:hypothetical protein
MAALDFVISCPCVHTLEEHRYVVGCGRCACSRYKTWALDALSRNASTDPAFYELLAQHFEGLEPERCIQ